MMSEEIPVNVGVANEIMLSVSDILMSAGISVKAMNELILSISAIMGYSRKYPHTPMDDIRNPVINAQ